jgi:hypothetical protein
MIDDDYGAVGGMRIGRGNRSTRRKPALVSLCPPQIPNDLTWDRTRAALIILIKVSYKIGSASYVDWKICTKF